MFAVSFGSVALAPEHSAVRVWWPAAGIGAILTSRFSGGRSALVAASISVVTFVAIVSAGTPVLVAGCLGVAFGAESWVAALVLRGRTGLAKQLTSLRALARLVIASVAGAVTAGVLGGIALYLIDGDSLFMTTGNLIVSHATSVLLIVPIVLATSSLHSTATRWEMIVQWVLSVAIIIVVFRSPLNLPLTFLPFGVLIWGVLRISQRQVACQLLVVGALVARFSEIGNGPFSVLRHGHQASSLMVQLYLLSLLSVFLMVSILVSKNAANLRSLSESEMLYRDNFTGAVIGMMVISLRDGVVTVEKSNSAARSILNPRKVSGANLWAGLMPESAVVLLTAADLISENGARAWRGMIESSTERVLEASLFAIAGDANARRYAIQISDMTEDIDARHSLLHSLDVERAAVEQLRALEAIKNSHLAEVGFELVTPLEEIIEQAEVLLDGDAGILTNGQLELVAKIEKTGRRLSRVVEELLISADDERDMVSSLPERIISGPAAAPLQRASE